MVKKRYCAISSKDGYRVCTIGPCNDFHPIGDIRSFSSFEEADKVAKDIAEGKYNYEDGIYINMR